MGRFLNSYVNVFFLFLSLIMVLLFVNQHEFTFLSFSYDYSSSISEILQKGIKRRRNLAPSDKSYTPIPKVNYGMSFGDPKETFRTYYNQTVKPPGILFKMKGGIGNQLFQYACSYALAQDLNFPLYIWLDESMSTQRTFAPSNREFALDQFNIPIDNFVNNTTLLLEMSPISDQDLLENLFMFRFRGDLDKRFLTLDGGSYCQSIEYWADYEDDIRSMFEPREEVLRFKELQPMVDKIEESESVSVHIRRGDFLTSKGYEVPISFQRRAIRKMAKILEEKHQVKPVFFVFSDDIKYASIKLKDLEKYYKLVFVSKAINNTTSIEEFFLMTKCKHNIFANSTFGWWAAFLNKNMRKIIITSTFNSAFFQLKKTPFLEELGTLERLSFFERIFGTLFHPKDWIVINPFTGGLEIDT